MAVIKFLIILMLIVLVIGVFSAVLPFILIAACILGGIYLIYKIYQACYFNSKKFAEIKQRISDYTNDCNELNKHIESLKDTALVSDKTDYGSASYHDSSAWNYKRKHLKDQKYAPNIHQCSRSVCDNARKKPFEYICKYFGIKATEESLSTFETILNNFEAAEEGKKHLQAEKEQIYKSIENDIPSLITRFSKKRVEEKLGFEPIDMSTTYFPRYKFKYVSSGGNASTECDIVMDIENLNKFVEFLSEKVKFKKSAAGQRALMTSKLRQHIKERDHYTCRQCGVSVEKEPHLLLEIDHIVPVSKGGLTVEDNLQTLCWRCNRSKGAKITASA